MKTSSLTQNPSAKHDTSASHFVSGSLKSPKRLEENFSFGSITSMSEIRLEQNFFELTVDGNRAKPVVREIHPTSDHQRKLDGVWRFSLAFSFFISLLFVATLALLSLFFHFGLL